MILILYCCFQMNIFVSKLMFLFSYMYIFISIFIYLFIYCIYILYLNILIYNGKLFNKKCNFRFTPIDSLIEWRKTAEKSSKQEKDFMAFLRIVRVHVTETKHILSVLYFLCYAYFPFSICFVIYLKYEITSFIINECRRCGKHARRVKRRLTNY